MRSLLSLSLVLGVLGASPLASAQKQEPVPPGQGDDNEVPQSRPRARQAAPGASIAPTGTIESQDTNLEPRKKFDPNDWKHALGAYARYIFVTELMLKPYLETATAMNSWAVGLQYTRRYTKFDVVTSLDFSWLNVNDGNWLGRGNSPELDTKYVQFNGLSFLSADVAIIGHHAFNDWLEIKGGAGLGIGVVFGDVLTTNNSNSVCNASNIGDTSKCYPVSPIPGVGPIYLNQPDTEQKLKATEDPAREDTAQNPHRKNSNKPPVMAVLNIMMALNFRLHRHVSTQIEIGFRDAMFVGAGLHYHF